MAKNCDIHENYIQFGAHSLKYLKELGIAKSVEKKIAVTAKQVSRR